MKNDPNRAAAEGMPAVDLDNLLIKFVKEMQTRVALEAAYDEAYATMPAWAQIGPEYLKNDGCLAGGDCPYPQVNPLPAPSKVPGVMVVIRPSPWKTWRDGTRNLSPAPVQGFTEDGEAIYGIPSDDFLAHRRSVRLAAFASVRKILARIRQQRAEREKAGLPSIDALQDAANLRLEEIERQIRAMATGASPSDLAAVALMEMRYWGHPSYPMRGQDECIWWVVQTLLGRLSPHLTGFLRIVVDDLVHGDDGRKLEETMIGGGVGGTV